jgi:hypothetical protein
MITCSRCPCTVYVTYTTVCFGCVGREDVPPTTHNQCSNCDKVICSEHRIQTADSPGMCYTCRHTFNLAMTSASRRFPPVPSMFLTEREEEDRYFMGVYIPSYLDSGKHKLRFTSAVFTRQWKSEICSICCEGFENSEFTVLGCEHAFHIECLTEWSRVRANCPMCRKKITPA